MAGGPPSSIDIGDGTGGPPSSVVGGDGGFYGGSSSTSSLTYFERKYGGEGDVDPSAFIPSYTPTDKGERETVGQRDARREEGWVYRRGSARA